MKAAAAAQSFEYSDVSVKEVMLMWGWGEGGRIGASEGERVRLKFQFF